MEPNKTQDDSAEFYCGECSATVALDDKICPKCGADVSQLDEDNDEKPLSAEASKKQNKPDYPIYHPWRRFFARMVDISFFGKIPFLGILYLALVILPRQTGAAMLSIFTFVPFFEVMLLCLLWIPIEALLLNKFGTTPGKWLFGINISPASGVHLSYSLAIDRTARVMSQGVGMGFPFLTVITSILGYRRLTDTGTTLWDAATHCKVQHKDWNTLRYVICFISAILTIALNAWLNMPK